MLSLPELQSRFFDSLARLPGAGPTGFDPALVACVEAYRRYPQLMTDIAAAMSPEEIGATGRTLGNEIDSVRLWGAANFPLVGRKVFGMLELYHRDARACDDHLVETMSRIGALLGQFLDQPACRPCTRPARVADPTSSRSCPPRFVKSFSTRRAPASTWSTTAS